MQLEVKEFQPPVIVFNSEELQKHLAEKLTEYKGLVVTEDTLQPCKTAQKELAGLRREIDDYRKEKKKEAEMPIKEFESKCKELISLVESVEAPIKDGISHFDALRKEEKRKAAELICKEEAEKAELNEKYASKLTVLDKYTNLTTTDKSVHEDAATRAFALKVEQDREEDSIRIVTEEVEQQNKRLKTPIKMEDVSIKRTLSSMESGFISASDALRQIREYGDTLYRYENPVVQEPVKEEPKPEPKVEKQEPVVVKPVEKFVAVLELSGTLEELRAVSAFIKEHNITYSVKEQRKAD
jgi:hypothetical protein